MVESERSSSDGSDAKGASDGAGNQRSMTAAARRALDEAEARRAALPETPAAEECGGRGGLEPARYGDWEVKGLASDF